MLHKYKLLMDTLRLAPRYLRQRQRCQEQLLASPWLTAKLIVLKEDVRPKQAHEVQAQGASANG